MVIGLLRVEVHYPESGSLKTKRSILKSVMDRLKKRFNVSVSEVEYQNLWQRSVLAVVTVNPLKKNAESTLSRILDLLDDEADLQVAGVQTEFL